MTVEIKLSGKHGGTALVDDEDAERVLQYSWWVVQGDNRQYPTFYACRSKSWGALERMHRFILGVPRGVVVDHIDYNGLNNTRANLRMCTISENTAHSRRPLGKCGFRGVKQDSEGSFRARVKKNGVDYVSYGHPTPEAAARAFDELARVHHGAFAILNFPESPAGAAEL